MNTTNDSSRAPELGPVSAVLECDLREQVRRHGIVLWLDAEGRYSDFVDELAQTRASGGLPYEVKAFRGSFLQLMMELAPLSSGTDREHLVVHLPGFNEETVKDTPLLELYRSGTRFRKALDTLVSEAAARRVSPERIEEFASGSGLTLEAADEWLVKRLEQPTGGLASLLTALNPCGLLDDLLRPAPDGSRGISRQVTEDYETFFAHLNAELGLPTGWRERTFREPASAATEASEAISGAASRTTSEGASDAAYVAASWALVVEYVHDLSHPPTSDRLKAASSLPASVIAACRELAEHLRRTHRDFYEQTARQTEDELLEREVSAARAADLGKIDTFPFEDEVVLDEALDAVREGAFSEADEWTRLRLDVDSRQATSFWLERRPSRKSEWQLVGAAATLGLAIETAGSNLAAKSLEQAAERYVDAGARVDRAHRHLEQQRHALLYSQLDRFEELRPLLDQMRERWRAWADSWAKDFSRLCKTEGFLPSAELMQRNLFDDVVRPAVAEGTTAYFVVDALRFEMGQELMRAMADSRATEAKLVARFAELPSNTEVGMNALSPVADGGRLSPSVKDGRFKGFQAGEFRVYNPDTRKRSMQSRVGGSCKWLTLEEVLNRGASSLKAAVSKSKLLVVHSEEIDKAGESDFGPKVFDQVLRQLRTAWRLLRDAGVKHFVISADHGFLLLHDRATNAQPHGRKIDPNRRHVISADAADNVGEVRVALADLAYEGVDGLHFLSPETTAAFDTGKRGGNFVHGGNSLQERLIPVLTVVHHAPAGGSSVAYGIAAKKEPGIAGLHCLRLEVRVAGQGGLDFARDDEVELALRVSDLPDVEVDLVQTRRGGRIVGGSLFAPVSRPIELFFRLHGATDARARLEVLHPGATADVETCHVAQRFEVASDGRKVDSAKSAPSSAPKSAAEAATEAATEAAKRPASEPAPRSAAAAGGAESAADGAWLAELPEGGIRALFAHLAAHGTVSESEATNMLGGARKLRRFSAQFESYKAIVPFSARIEIIAGVKTYVRD